ncbi:MAG: hypothetical protein SOT60_00795 [Bilifractor sp.]|nr:hypothetical protein [Bilifractor sp.]
MKNIWKQTKYLRERIRLDRKTFLLYSVLRILVILTAVRCFFTRNYEGFALCLLSLILFLLPSFFEEKLKLEIPPLFEGIIYLFIYAAEILGEVNHYYTAIPGWDTMLHTLNGFLCAAIGFSLVDILNRKSHNLNLSPLYLSIVAFCFSMTIGVIWEFIEFTFDQFFYLDMQKDFIVRTIGSVTLDPTHSQIPVRVSNITRTIIETAGGKTYTIKGGYLDIGIIDTMKDLIVNFVGAVAFSIIGYFSVKYRDRKNGVINLAEDLRVRTLSDEDLLKQREEIDKRLAESKEERSNVKNSLRRGIDRQDR